MSRPQDDDRTDTERAEHGSERTTVITDAMRRSEVDDEGHPDGPTVVTTDRPEPSVEVPSPAVNVVHGPVEHDDGGPGNPPWQRVGELQVGGPQHHGVQQHSPQHHGASHHHGDSQHHAVQADQATYAFSAGPSTSESRLYSTGSMDVIDDQVAASRNERAGGPPTQFAPQSYSAEPRFGHDQPQQPDVYSEPTMRFQAPSPPGVRPGGPSTGTSTRVRPSGARVPRRASLQLRRLEPWSVLKLSLVLAVAGFLAWMVAVGVLYGVLQGMGVWDQLNGTYSDLTSAADPNSGDLISAGRVFSVAAVIGAVNILLMTAVNTVASFIYNVSADLAGGVEVTLAERD